jgi:4-amino-4-deoxy-L-arabinose transferase-like glycosyltransferase
VKGQIGGAILLLLGVGALVLSHDFMGAPGIGNDSVQYLDAASHLAAGDCFCTTVAHFDEQVAVGHMPIPFTHFAPGYSLLIAGFIRLGFTPESAAYLISALSYLATIVLFWYIGATLGAHPFVLGAIGLIWLANASAIVIAGFVSTEALFTAIFLGVAALIVADIRAGGSHPWVLVTLGILAGAAYWVRYPGLFVVPVVALYLIWRGLRNRRTLPWVLLGLALAVAECIGIMARNSWLTGSWRGGFSSSHKNGLKWVLAESVKAFYHMVFGDRVVAHLSLWVVLFACALLAAIVLAFRAWRTERRQEVPAGFTASAIWLALLVGFYWAGIVYAVMHSIASDLARYYFPAYPLVLVVLAAATLARTRIENVAIAILAVAVLAVQSRSLLTRPPTPPALEVRNDLKEEVRPGLSIGNWLTSHVSPKDVLIAANGQMVYYILQRPVVALIDPPYSARNSDDAGLHALMSQFGARYLLLFPGSKAVPEQDDTPFLSALATGSAPPWLTLANRTNDVEVYECASCVKNFKTR